MSVSLEEGMDALSVELPTCEIEQEIHAHVGSEHFLLLLDPDLQAYVRLRLNEDCETFEEFAGRLHITTRDVRNLDRRLQRRRKLYE